MANIVVIPARGGSQRIPRKNILPMAGKPLIAFSIELAQQSQLFDRIIVSTDDEEIAMVARHYGAETPFTRPSQLADHFTGTTAVMQHALNWLKAENQAVEYGCLLYATCPLLQSTYLTEGLDAVKRGAPFSFAATGFDFPIQRALILNQQGQIEPIFPQFISQRSQDLQDCFHDAGQFYWGRPQAWLEADSIFTPESAAVRIPRHLTQDLDTWEDWQVLEQKLILART